MISGDASPPYADRMAERSDAELYSHLGERELLAGLLSRAAVSPEPETRELVEDFGDELTAVEIPEPPKPPV